MSEPKDSELPREERLFARVPKVTNEKIAYLAKRWGTSETLSTADVIVRVVEEAHLKAKEDRTMRVETEKKLLQRIKAGKEDRGILPVPPDESIGIGDILIFREATFDPHQIPTLVPNGDSVSMQITKAEDTGEKYRGSRLYAFQWRSIGYAYGNLKTGTVVGARQIGKTPKGDDILKPEIDGPADPKEWVPGVLGADGNFHPGDQTKKPPGGKWII